jgi:hypothetical protein
MRIKTLQLTCHSAFQSPSGRVWHLNLGASIKPRRRCGSQLSADPLDSTGRSARLPNRDFLREPLLELGSFDL